MKKIALFSLMCCFGMINAYGANQCKTSIPFKIGNNNWNAGSDEYLFENERDYMNAVNTGWFYECDNENCPDNSYVEVNSKHVFEGKTIHRAAKYKCSLNALNDKWVEVGDVKGLTKCTKKQRWKDGNLFANAEADEYLYPTVEDYNALKSLNYPQVYECDSSVCTDGKIITLPAGHYFKRNRINTQRKYKCVLGDPGNDKWVDITDDCKDCGDKAKPQPQPQPVTGGCLEIDGVTRIAKGKNSVHQVCQVKALSDAGAEQCVCQCVDNNKWRCDVTSCKGDSAGRNYNWVENETNVSGGKGVCKEAKKGTPVTKSCKDSRKTQTGKACCDVPKTQATYDEKTDKCNCLVPNAVFDIIQGKGQCVVKETPVPPVVEEDKDCFKYISAKIRCDNGNSYSEEGWQKVKQSEFASMSCEEIKKSLDEDTTRLFKLFKELCKEKQPDIYVPQPQTGPSEREVEQAQNVLSAFTASAKDEASVWKTAEGNFNGARLASDITAGVVLGTVGGVVTGNIIKKNQVKKGFEALHCTVGGQKVADWGDEFSVGLQR